MCIQTTSNDTVYGEHLKINNHLQLLTGYVNTCNI